MEYEVGIRLDRIEGKLDKIIAQLASGMTADETKLVTKELSDVADKLDAVGASGTGRPKPKVGGK